MSGRTEDGGREGGCGDCELLLHSQGTSRGKLLGPGTSEEDEGRRVGHVRMDRRREERGKEMRWREPGDQKELKKITLE